MPKIDEKKFLFLLIFLHLAIALPLAFYLNIWVDEASTLYTTQNGISQTFNNLFTDEKQAPLYFLLMSLWRKLSDSIFFARLFSIICSALAIKVFFDLARKIWEDKRAFFFSAFFALHPFLFWASLEIRLYSLVILLSVLLLKFFYQGYMNRGEAETQRKAQIYFILTAIAALYTNYYLGFLLVGCFVALLVLRRWKEAKNYFIQMLFVGLAILPLLWIVQQQFSVRVVHLFQTERSMLEGLSIFWNHFLTFILPTEIFPPEDVSVFSMIRNWIVRLAIVALLVISFKNKGKNLDENVFAFGTISAVTSGFLLFVYFQLGAGYIEIRHAAVFFVPLILFVFSIWTGTLTRVGEGAEPQSKKFIAISLAVLYAMFFSYSLFALYPNLTKRGDWARVGEYIRQNEKPGQPIVVFQAYEAIALPYHYKGVNRILPDEKFFAFDLEAQPGTADSYRSQIEFIISKIPAEAEEIWLLTNEKCAAREACRPLENFVAANYTIVQEKEFYKEKTRLLRRKAK